MDITCPICGMYYMDCEYLSGQKVECECGHKFVIAATDNKTVNTLSDLKTFANGASIIGVEDTLSGMTTVGADDVIAAVDGFVFKEKLGEGGYGVVYRATDSSGCDVAIKLLPSELCSYSSELAEVNENFELVAGIQHSNIVKLSHIHQAIDVDLQAQKNLGIVRGAIFMIMEYVPGITICLWRRRFNDNCVPFTQAVDLCRQVAEALDFAHSEKIIHRDIKPSNIIVTADNKVKVLDFGIAAQIRTTMNMISIKKSLGLGTPTHMAPEQWDGKRQGPATDQYALAVLFYELICGDIPFATALHVGPEAQCY